MTKEVIYIDVEDDITTIVGKIKDSTEKIIALVPPSRVGVLQSAVSMRLLQRTAEQQKKRLVLITNNSALTSLAAAAKIPVAKNLQSKPELAEVPVLKVDNDEVIDGEMLPVGELAKAANSDKTDPAVAAAIQSSTIENMDSTKKVKKTKQKKTAVPNFSDFRKKLLIFGGAGLALILFLVWAIWFAPRATVVITAKTTTTTVNDNVNLTLDGATDAKNKTIKATRQEQKKDLAVEFTPTGKKKVGDKATGQVQFSTNAITMLGKTIPAGTEITSSSGAVYLTNSAATFSLDNFSGIKVGVTAEDIGPSYNGATGNASGAPSGVSVKFTTATSGGTSREVTVVSADDVAKATDKLNEQKDDTLKAKLTGAFGSSSVIIGDSYQEKRSDPAPSVAVDAEASGPVSLKTTLTVSMMAIDKVDLSNYLKSTIKDEIKGKKAQKIYKDGAEGAKFSQFGENEGAFTVRLSANGTVGPEINEAEVKEQAKGKSYGDIQSSIESIEGIDDVDTKFWPFWVRTVPNDVKRIAVEFKLQDAN